MKDNEPVTQNNFNYTTANFVPQGALEIPGPQKAQTLRETLPKKHAQYLKKRHETNSAFTDLVGQFFQRCRQDGRDVFGLTLTYRESERSPLNSCSIGWRLRNFYRGILVPLIVSRHNYDKPKHLARHPLLLAFPDRPWFKKKVATVTGKTGSSWHHHCFLAPHADHVGNLEEYLGTDKLCLPLFLRQQRPTSDEKKPKPRPIPLKTNFLEHIGNTDADFNRWSSYSGAFALTMQMDHNIDWFTFLPEHAPLTH